MKVLVCGGREYVDGPRVRDVLSAFHAAQPIAWLGWCGEASARHMALNWAKESRVRAQVGPIRDVDDLARCGPDVLVAFPGGKGTAGMVKMARDAGVEVLVIKENER